MLKINKCRRQEWKNKNESFHQQINLKQSHYLITGLKREVFRPIYAIKVKRNNLGSQNLYFINRNSGTLIYCLFWSCFIVYVLGIVRTVNVIFNHVSTIYATSGSWVRLCTLYHVLVMFVLVIFEDR